MVKSAVDYLIVFIVNLHLCHAFRGKGELQDLQLQRGPCLHGSQSLFSGTVEEF